jgi:hypothetical protein
MFLFCFPQLSTKETEEQIRNLQTKYGVDGQQKEGGGGKAGGGGDK